MNWTDLGFGFEYRTKDFLMFFGNKEGSLEKLQDHYPGFSFRFLKQVHGDQCVLSGNEVVEADAHYTEERNTALCIRTADCNPILIADTHKICAIHAGWRGVKSNILEKSIKVCFGNLPADASLAVGPHIQKDSFQVDESLGEEFSSDFGSQFVFKKDGELGKSYVDLKAILNSSVSSHGGPLWMSEEDTLSSDNYFSHRREPDNKGRNISFVARL